MVGACKVSEEPLKANGNVATAKIRLGTLHAASGGWSLAHG
jgi:hypothetical protein